MLLLLALATIHLAGAINNGLARKPQLAWNSWNHFACNVNQTVLRDTADAIVATGLHAAGYQYINVDDCWASFRNPNGTVHADPETFPDGMASLADYMHARGLLFGLYTDLGYLTCAGRPGSLGYEAIDAITYAEWKVDYVKVDNCNTDGSAPELRYPVMSQALNESGRHIFFSMCEWGVDGPSYWAPTVGNSWRTTGDINDHWSTMTNRLDLNEPLYPFAGPGGWNDPDMLEVGNGGMTTAEYQSHFSLWALMKAPMIIGCDVTRMDNATLHILANREVIAISQDVLGIQGRRVWSTGTPDGAKEPSMKEQQRRRRHSRGHFGKPEQDAKIGTTDYGTGVTVEPCSANNPTQSWSYQSSGGGLGGSIVENQNLYCLDIDYCRNWTTGNHVSVYPCHDGGCSNGTNQRWHFADDGTIRSDMQPQTGNWCLTAVPFRSDLPHDGHRMYFAQSRPCVAGDVRQQWTYVNSQIQSAVASNASNGEAYCLSLFRDVAPGALEVWAGPLQHGDIAVVLFNRGVVAANITASWTDIGAASPSQRLAVRDLVAHSEVGVFTSSFTAAVDAHASKTFRFRRVA